MIEEGKIFVENAYPYYDAVRFFHVTEDRKYQIFYTLERRGREPGLQSDASLSLSPKLAQDLMNGLWNAGFRPNDGEGSGGHIAALKYHLEDMRKLVFKEKK